MYAQQTVFPATVRPVFHNRVPPLCVPSLPPSLLIPRESPKWNAGDRVAGARVGKLDFSGHSPGKREGREERERGGQERGIYHGNSLAYSLAHSPLSPLFANHIKDADTVCPTDPTSSPQKKLSFQLSQPFGTRAQNPVFLLFSP